MAGRNHGEFCKASDVLRNSVADAKEDLRTYYGDRTEDTHIQLAVDKAEWAIYESYNQDSLVFYNLALKDSVALTEKIIRPHNPSCVWPATSPTTNTMCITARL